MVYLQNARGMNRKVPQATFLVLPKGDGLVSLLGLFQGNVWPVRLTNGHMCQMVEKGSIGTHTVCRSFLVGSHLTRNQNPILKWSTQSHASRIKKHGHPQLFMARGIVPY